jgi:hypothetical protein
MRALALAVVLLLAAPPSIARTADAPKAETRAACHDANGKTKACPKAPRKKVAPVGNGSSAFARCRDVVSHRFTKCGGPNAEPVPAN